jgi:PcfJ-like protein
MQLAESFPLLAYLTYVHSRGDQDKRNAASAMVDRGVMLRDIAAIWELPMALRRVKPGAVHLVFGLLQKRPQLLDHMPEPLPQMRRWLIAVRNAESLGGGDYATWVARNWSDIRDLQEMQDLGDWITASALYARAQTNQELEHWAQQNAPARLAARVRELVLVEATQQFNPAVNQPPIERPFVSSMSLRTVRELSAQWHESVAQAKESEVRPFPQPWFPASKLVNGYEVVPIVNSADLYREGKTMHHCVGSYSHDVIAGRKYIYSVREGDDRIATFELVRNGDAKAALGQIRGNCNAHVPKQITDAVRRWLRSQKIELPVLPEPAEIPF